MSRNRLAQNELTRDFCENSGIPLLDLTPVFQENFEAGHNLYFPDDSHWNAAGHELAAAELAKFMRERVFTSKRLGVPFSLESKPD
jgi:hypothetical protein